MSDEKTLVGGIPVSKLRELMSGGSDEQLATFMQGYALGCVADLLVANMNRMPHERAGFFVAMAGTYPEDWNKAIAIIQATKASTK